MCTVWRTIRRHYSIYVCVTCDVRRDMWCRKQGVVCSWYRNETQRPKKRTWYALIYIVYMYIIYVWSKYVVCDRAHASVWWSWEWRDTETRQETVRYNVWLFLIWPIFGASFASCLTCLRVICVYGAASTPLGRSCPVVSFMVGAAAKDAQIHYQQQQ